MDATEIIYGCLNDGETLLWAGRARQGMVIRVSELLFAPISLFVSAWMVYAAINANRQNGSLPFAIVAVALMCFNLVGLYQCFWGDARRRVRTFYGVTSERLLIVAPFFFRPRVTSIPLDIDFSFQEGKDGQGTIWFGPVPYLSTEYWGLGGYPQSPRFELDANASAVFETILAAKRSFPARRRPNAKEFVY